MSGRWKGRLAVLAAVTSCVLANRTVAADGRGAACEQLWLRESAQALHGGDGSGYEQLLARWRAQRQACAGTVAWEARLAIACAAAGKPDEAREVLAPLQGLASEYAYLVDLASLQIPYFGLARGPTAKEQLEAVERQFRAYVRKYPGVPEGHAQLGAIQTMRGEHADAVASLSRALRSRMDLSGVHRNLTISFSALGRHAEAMKAADAAVDLAPELFSDPPFVYAAAKSFAASGKVDAAVTALNVIATKQPQLRNDPEFWEAANFVKARKAAATPRGASR